MDANIVANPNPIVPSGGLPFGVPTEAPPGDFNFKPSSDPVPDTAIPNRAARVDFTLGDKSPGVPSIISMMKDSNEEELRRQAMLQEQSDFVNHKHDMMMKLIQNSPNGISSEEASFVDNLSQVQFNTYRNKDTILEQKFGEKVVRTVNAADPNQTVSKAEVINPESVHQQMDIHEAEATKQEILKREAEDVHDQLSKQGLLGKVWDFAEDMIPLWGTFKLHDLVVHAPMTSLLPGDNLFEQISYIRSISDPAVFKQTLHDAAMSIGNLHDRDYFVNAVGAYGISDQAMANLGGAADLGTTLGPAVKGLGKAAVRIASQFIPDIGEAARIAGNTQAAGKIAAEKILNDIPLRDQQIVEQKATSIFNPTNWLTGKPADLTRTNVNKFSDMVDKNVTAIKDLLNNSASVDRTNDATRQAILDDLFSKIGTNDQEALSNSVLDVARQHNELTNTDSVHIHLGKTNGEQFSNKLSAQKFAADYLPNYKLTDANFVNQDGKWHVRLDLDLPDHLENYKDIIPETDRIKTSMLNRFIGGYRNQSNVLGEGISQARKVVAHGNQKIFDTFQKITKPIADLSNKERTNLSTLLEDNRDYVDYSTPGEAKRGQFYETLADFQHAYHDRFGTLPSDKQTRAYYAYVQANQLDGMIRNAGWLRDNIRLGLKDWSDKFGKDEFKFRGKAVSSISTERSAKPISIAVRDSKTGDLIHIYDKDNITSPAKKAILDRELANNAIIVTPDRGTVKVPGFENKQGVTFYVSGTSKESRLSMDAAWKDGGHVINEHRFYVKQPQLEDGWFRRDLAFATAPNEKVAKQRAAAIETARQMMLRGDAGLDEFVSKNIGNGMDAATFKSNFFKGGFDPNTPFYHTPSGIQTVDYHKMEGVTALHRHPYDQRQLDRAFAGERDATNIPALIDEKDVKHIFQDGKLMDPLPSLVKAAKSMVDVKLKRDYILKAANLWSDQFKDLLEPSESQIHRDPMNALYNGDKLYRPHADSNLVAQAENARKNILGFAGMRTRMDTAFDAFSSRMEEIAYDKLGDEKSRIVSAWLAPLIKNPIVAAKSTAATLKLGLFSPAQLLMQAMSLVSVLSLSPRAGFKASMVYLPMRYSLNSETLAEHAVGMAKLMGWNGDHFREMMEGLNRSGWGFAHGDRAILDAVSTPKIFQGKVGKAIDMGNIFVTEGVRAHRLPAYGAAYLEWRAANPSEKLTRSAEHAILSRADDLSNNMSAANNAVWQKGLLGIPTQFMTFPMRLAEGYWASHLSVSQRLSMFAGYSLAFGLPTSLAGAGLIWPLYESTKNYLLEHNIPHDDNATQVVLNGLPQMMTKMATGSNFQFGNRFGEGGIRELRDAIYSDKQLWEFATGAVGSVFGDIATSSWPALKGIWSILTEDPKDRTYPLDIQDLVHPLQNVTSLDAATKLIYAMNTHRWMSKYDQPMDTVTNGEALTMALTGAKLESIEETFNMKEVLKGRTDNDAKAMIQIGDLLERALNSNDPIQRKQYMTQAKAQAVLNALSPDKFSAVLKQAFQKHGVDAHDAMERRLIEDSYKRSLTTGVHP